MRSISINRRSLLPLFAVVLLAGCHSTPPVDPTPHFNPGEGAISGEIIGADHEPFDLELAGGQKALKIELLSPVQGVCGVAYPIDKDAHFVFSHIAPGRYELNIFVSVPGKRSISVSNPVIVDAEKITPVKLLPTVTPTDTAP